jgi:hypothetical protein
LRRAGAEITPLKPARTLVDNIKTEREIAPTALVLSRLNPDLASFAASSVRLQIFSPLFSDGASPSLVPISGLLPGAFCCNLRSAVVNLRPTNLQASPLPFFSQLET